jgi:hypothetical protein
MKIYATQDFLIGYKRYEQGQVYNVSETQGRNFIILGWAAYAGKTPLWRRILEGVK